MMFVQEQSKPFLFLEIMDLDIVLTKQIAELTVE